MVISAGLKGGIKTSTMLPWILAISSDDAVLANEFWAIAIMIRPGARNWLNGTSQVILALPPNARLKIARNKSVVSAGANSVWVATLAKRWTSLA